MKKNLLVLPLCRYFKILFVGSDRVIVVLNKGRIILMGKCYIYIYGYIITLHFPVGRYFNIIPVAGIIIIPEKPVRSVTGSFYKIELPYPVKGKNIRRSCLVCCQGRCLITVTDQGCMRSFLVLSDHFRIFPVAGFLLGKLHAFIFTVPLTGRKSQ